MTALPALARAEVFILPPSPCPIPTPTYIAYHALFMETLLLDPPPQAQVDTYRDLHERVRRLLATAPASPPRGPPRPPARVTTGSPDSPPGSPPPGYTTRQNTGLLGPPPPYALALQRPVELPELPDPEGLRVYPPEQRHSVLRGARVEEVEDDDEIQTSPPESLPESLQVPFRHPDLPRARPFRFQPGIEEVEAP
jgi:hypothetical protein